MKSTWHSVVRSRALARNLASTRNSRRYSRAAGNDTTQITTLPNKIRVATDSTPGHFSSVGVYIDAGSRYEAPRLSGASHMIDRMAFKSTETRTADEMSTLADTLGGQILCSSSRETMMYQSSHPHSSTPAALSLISDTILRPLFRPEEVDLQREAAAYEVREINAKPEMILPEILHQVAYQGNTLGNPLLCPEEMLEVLNSERLKEYVKTWYRPDRIVIAGAGIAHAELVELVDKHFSNLKLAQSTPIDISNARNIPTHLLSSTKPASSPSLFKSMTTAASSILHPSTSEEPSFASLASEKARYTGGHHFIHSPDLDFTHIYLGFEGMSIHEEDIYTLATMQILLGGGGSFSAGGPGKGMYSRLYTHVLNHYPTIDHCSSFHHIYTDSSLFGLIATAHPTHNPRDVLPILAHQLSLLLHTPLPQSELKRAKNQLMSSLVMSLESRAVEVEDLGRQVLVHGRKVSVQEMCDKIEKVTTEDVRRVAKKVFGSESSGPPTVLVMGREDVGDWKRVLAKYGVGRHA